MSRRAHRLRAAEAFPILDDDELGELAAHIKANGLQQPLVVAKVDGQMMLIDGRTRRMACLALGIVPDYVLLDGQDPITYIMSANVHRRHMTKGQRAMAVARVLETNQVSQRKAADSLRIKQPMLAKASIVLRHASDLANAVLMGHLSLDNAYEEAPYTEGPGGDLSGARPSAGNG